MTCQDVSYICGRALTALAVHDPELAARLLRDVPIEDRPGVSRGMASTVRLPRHERHDDLAALREAVIAHG
jgi:hypothetical protein